MTTVNQIRNRVVDEFSVAEAVDEALFDEYSQETRVEVTNEIVFGMEQAVRDGLAMADEIEAEVQERGE